MRGWLAVVVGLLVSPAWAAETTVNWGLKTGPEPRTLCVYDTSTLHTCVPVGQLNSTNHSFGSECNVISKGADPTGAADSSAAFNACAAVTVNGQKANVYAPAGTYFLRSRVVVGDQCLYGDGRANTFLHVDQTFDPAADSVIKLSGTRNWTTGNAPAPCVRDLDIQFDQPTDQGVRANFKTLAAGCTSGLGGSGCKYPPAIYNDALTGFRPRIANVRIERAWDGINLQSAGGTLIDTIEEGSLDVGLTLAGGADFGYVSHWEHHGQFGLSGFWALYTGIYEDGNTYAAKIGKADGVVVQDFRSWEGRIELTSAFSWGSFTNLEMDGNNSTLEVNAVAAGAGGLQITSMYATGGATGANTHCQIDIGPVLGQVILDNIHILVGGGASNIPALCTAGAKINIGNSQFFLNTNTVPVLLQTAGNVTISGSSFHDTNPVINHSLPFVNVTGGTMQFLANAFPVAATGSPEFALALPDAVENAVIGNSFNGWRFASPGPLGAYGPNGQKCTASGASPQVCNGWSGVVTTAALATAALGTSTYQINDTSVSTTSIVKCQVQSYAGTGMPIITQCAPAGGAFTVTIYNAHASLALNAALTIGFTVQ